MNQETVDLLNSVTSSFMVFLLMVVFVNISMMLGSVFLTAMAGWAGIHFGMQWFSHITVWKV